MDLEGLVLGTLNSPNGAIEDSFTFAETNAVDHQKLIGAVKSLEGDLYVTSEQLSLKYWELTEEGRGVAANGSPEYQVYKKVGESDGGLMSLESLNGALGDVAKIGLGQCMKNKWLAKTAEGISAVASADSVSDSTAALLSRVDSGVDFSAAEEKELMNLKKRKLCIQIVRKYIKVAKGSNFRPVRKKKMADITKEMLETETWKDMEFKSVNLKAMGAPVGGGAFHPLMKVRAEFRRILMEMGFEEMPTNKWVESSFWNFDSLFQPQSHPARDAHDTFFMKGSCAEARSFPPDYYEKVKNIHESGGFGSIGYGCMFKEKEARKNLLRTHTTAISAQMLYKLANQEGGFKPAKFFSVDRVFRNETADATHLCEFHQVEGLVADYDLTLGNLIGVIKTFFEKIGITQLRFKPAYNPYTEPSMEIFGYHPERKSWTEIGNSGMFRPEMLRPMGLPENVRVIAWGLSLERPTMIKYKIMKIKELFGHEANLKAQQRAPIARF